MQGVVYVDMLVLVNGVIAAFLLRCAARVSASPSSGGRLLAGSLIAGLSSLILLLPPLPTGVIWIMKVLSLLLSVRATFRWQGIRWFLRALMWYMAFNMLLAGVVLAALYYSAAGDIQINNLTVYFNVSPLELVVCVTVVYLAANFCVWTFGQPGRHPAVSFAAWFGRHEICGTALLDTGFAVRDPVTGENAFLLSFPSVRKKLPAELAQKLHTYFETGTLELPLRVIPTQTAAGMRVLPAVRAERLFLNRGGGLKMARCRLAVFTPEQLGGGQFDAVVAAQEELVQQALCKESAGWKGGEAMP